MKKNIKKENKLQLYTEINSKAFFEDGYETSVIPLVQTGYYEPGVGEAIKFTLDHFNTMIENFEENVTEYSVSIYYGHWRYGAGEGKAAGEIETLSIDYNELTGKHLLKGKVVWTPEAVKAIKNKEWKYVSIEMFGDYRIKIGPEEYKNYGAVLTGVALTNQPAVYDLPKIAMSVAKPQKKFQNKIDANEKDMLQRKNRRIKMEELLKKLGFANENDLVKEFTDIKSQLANLKAKNDVAKFESLLVEKDKEIETLKNTMAKEKQAAFEKERNAYAQSLFQKEMIDKVQYEQLVKEDEAGFETFKKYFSSNSKKGSVLPKVLGVGRLESEGDNNKDGVVSFDSYIEKYLKKGDNA